MLVACWVVAITNFRMVDTVLGPAIRPEVSARLAPLSEPDRRMVLRHLVSEVNRWIFRWWSAVQVLLGALLVVLLWRGPGGPRWLMAAASLVALVQALLLVPSLVEMGRGLDFLPRPLPPETARRFGLLHGGYVAADLLKAALLLLAAWLLGRRG